METKKSPRQFVYTQLASFFGLVSGSMVFMAFPWLAIQLTGSATSSGILVAVTSIPSLLLAPVIGSIIDKMGRRRTSIVVELLTGLAGLLIPLAAGLWQMTLPLLIAVGVIRSIVASGGMSARKALIPDVAKMAGISLERANSISESVFAAGFASGPAVAAFCIPIFGIYNTFFVITAIGWVSAGFMMLVRVNEAREEDHEDEKNLFKFAMEGFKILGRTPSVAIMMVGVMSLAMIYLPTEMVVLPKYFNSINDPASMGLLLSAMAAMTMVGSLLFEKFTKYMSFANVFRFALLGVAISLVPMSFLPPYWLLITFGFMLGFAWGPMPPLLNTVIQRKVPPSTRGRVFSLEMVIWSGGPMISMPIAGLAVDSLGVQITFWIIATLVLTSAILVTTNKHMKEINTAEFAD
jgi:DHA3 family macrolide efflux protein-like MFS transporter